MLMVHRTTSLAAVVCMALSLVLIGCTVDRPVPTRAESVSSPQPDPSANAVRQTDSSGRRLPFTTHFPNRWSYRNDGTDYEPCTSVDPKLLVLTGFDPESVSDAALADGQTLRGCIWNGLADSAIRLSQFLSNSKSIAEYKRNASEIYYWEPDIEIGGRTVAVGQDRDSKSCMSVVQSGRANISTLISYSGVSGVNEDICDKVKMFTKATIGGIPE